MPTLSPSAIASAHQRWLSAVSSGPDGALTATRAALSGCRAAMDQIEAELRLMNYPVQPLRTPCENVDAACARLEQAIGQPPPRILVELWREVGAIHFVEPGNYEHVDFWRRHGLMDECGDGVCVEACTPDWVDYTIESFLDRARSEWPDEWSEAPPFMLEISADRLHKDNISGGPPYALLPGGEWLAPLQGFSWRLQPASAPGDPPDLMGYLRTAILECAGFPGFHGCVAFGPVRERLLRHVRAF
ncbi:MAG: hypothetical protein Q4G70_10395 [Pseudomonadota bacterium]|nr:hypothetical protein [Pseudomonadota bacterium]